MSDGWTRTPNIILDAVPDMSEAELKLTMVLVRLTFGYHRTEVRMTYDDMNEATGLSKPAISSAIDRIEERGFFHRGRRSLWLVNSKKFLQKDFNDSKNSLLNETGKSKEFLLNEDANSKKSLPYESKNSLPSSIKEKKEEKEIDNPFPFQPSSKQDLPEHRGPADKRLDAIMAVCGYDPSIDRHLRLAESAAAQLRSYSAGAILDRYRLAETPPEAWYWYRDDWRGRRGQRPTPDGILETISLDRVPESAVVNGRASPASAEQFEAATVPHTGTGW